MFDAAAVPIQHWNKIAIGQVTAVLPQKVREELQTSAQQSVCLVPPLETSPFRNLIPCMRIASNLAAMRGMLRVQTCLVPQSHSTVLTGPS